MVANASSVKNEMWTVEFTTSETNVKPGQVVDLTVRISPSVKTYDFRLEVLSSPTKIIADSSLIYWELEAGLHQSHVFKLKIPEDASKGIMFQIDVRIEGYKNPPLFALLWWRPHKILWFGEDPTILDSRDYPMSSIKLTVT